MSTRNDRDLGDLLGADAGRIGAAYRKLSKMEPPRRLDRNVLAEASRAVHGRPRASRWLLGIGTAAGVLLAGGIAWRVNHDMLRQRESAPMSSPAAEAVPSGVIRVEPRDNWKGSDKVAPPEQPLESDVADGEVAGAASRKRNSPVERKASQAKQKLDSGFVPDPTIKKSVPKPAPEATRMQEEIREEAAPRAPPAPAPPVASAPEPSSMAEESNSAQSRRASNETESSMASEPMQKAGGAGQNAADSSNIPTRDEGSREQASSFGDAGVTAKIDRIRALLRAGEREEALKSLRELRRQHPDLVLPADLRALDG